MQFNEFSFENWKISCDIKNENPIAFLTDGRYLNMCLKRYPELKGFFIDKDDCFILLNLSKLESLSPFKWNGKIYNDILFQLDSLGHRWMIILSYSNNERKSIQGIICHDFLEYSTLVSLNYSAATAIRKQILEMKQKISEKHESIRKLENDIVTLKQFMKKSRNGCN